MAEMMEHQAEMSAEQLEEQDREMALLAQELKQVKALGSTTDSDAAGAVG